MTDEEKKTQEIYDGLIEERDTIKKMMVDIANMPYPESLRCNAIEGLYTELKFVGLRLASNIFVKKRLCKYCPRYKAHKRYIEYMNQYVHDIGGDCAAVTENTYRAEGSKCCLDEPMFDVEFREDKKDYYAARQRITNDNREFIKTLGLNLI